MANGRWFVTGDNRIAITGGDQCLDEGDNGVQTYKCTPGNTNQGKQLFLSVTDLQCGISRTQALRLLLQAHPSLPLRRQADLAKVVRAKYTGERTTSNVYRL
jgi:hypothetical protein